MKNLLYAGAFAAASIIPTSCEKPKIEPPTVNLEISPEYGRHPLTTSIKLSGTSNEGKITNYILTMGGKKIRDANYPLDTLITFKNYSYYKDDTKSINVIGEVVDSEGNTTKQYGIITVYPRGVNPFIQPNDSTLNWYGSGDVDNNNTHNSQDLDRMVAIINGTYSNPSDKRLYDRADVNGDEVVNSEDVDILSKKLNGTRLYLPGEWNLLLTWAEREDWFKKMLKIDKTNEIPYSLDFNCDEHAYQVYMNFTGLKPDEIEKFLAVTPAYDTTNVGRFNIPVEFVAISFYDLDNKRLKGHAINTVNFGNSATKWEDKCKFEPGNDKMYANVSTDYEAINNPSDHQVVFIRGRPVLSGGVSAGLHHYLTYTNIKNNISTGTIEINPFIDLVLERGK